VGNELSGYNNLTLEVYSAFSTTRVLDVAADLSRAQALRFETIYPGGLHSTLTFTVMRDPTRSWLFKQGQRLVARNGLTICWEGIITSPGYFEDETTGGRTITATGAWGRYLGGAGMRKAWADTRIDANAWVEQPGPGENLVGPARCTVDRLSRIRFIPRDAIRWNAAERAAVLYTAPTGQTVKRITYNYDFSTTASISPSLVIYFQVAGTTYTKESALYDGNATAGVTFATFITTDWLYVGMNAADTDKLQPGDTVSIGVTMGGTVNAVASVLSGQYWNTTTNAWVAIGGGITDGTASGGKTLAQTGNITFAKPGDMGATPLADANKSSKIWVRFAVSVNLTANIVINEITFGMVQNWKMLVFNETAAADEAASVVSSTGTGSIDITFATPTQTLELRIASNIQQTPFGNGTIHASYTALTVYMDSTNPLTATEVAKDWLTNLSNLNSDTSQIATNSLSVVPWMTGTKVDWESAQANLMRLAALGDSSFNAWAAYLLDSEQTATPNGKPVLAYQQQPALSDYDYAVTLGAGTLQSISIMQTPVLNDVIVSYVDANGVTQWLTSADDGGLGDGTSQLNYGGTFQASLQAQTTSSTVAATLGKRYLAQNKDVHFYVSGSIPQKGYLLGKNGNPVPASEVRAGKRLKVLNWLTDEVGVSAAGLVFIISHTSYDDDSETVTIDCGLPDSLAIMIARLVAFPGRGLT